MTDARIFLFCVLLASICQNTDAIKCYTCNSAHDVKCKDPFTSSDDGVDCTPQLVQKSFEISKGISNFLGIDLPSGTSDKHFVCQKLELKDLHGTNYIVRSCGVSKDLADMCSLKNVTACHQCNVDLCNAAERSQVPRVLYSLLPLLVMILRQ